MDASINSPIDKAATISEWVWYSSNAALKEGQALCYNWDYGTAGTREPRRYNEVETPTTLNAQHFAGVSAAAHSAKSGGQLIEIYVPGSVCNVLLGKDTSTTIGVGLLTFDVTTGYVGQFRYEGLSGAGSIEPLQSVTADGTNTATCLALLQEGPPSGGVEVVQLVDNAAWVAMVGGTTLVIGAACSTGSPTEEVLDGTIEGLRKKVEVITTAVTSNEAALDIENDDGITLAGGALASCALGAIGDQVVLEWSGGAWRNASSTGVSES